VDYDVARLIHHIIIFLKEIVMKIWQTEINLDIINARGKNTMIEHLGIEFIELGDDYVVARMPVDYRTKQPIGIMHGGASCVLAETAGSLAANFCVDIKTHYCVGLDINTNHIRSAREGFVYGTAKPFHLGRTTQVWSIEIVDDQKKLISVNRLTMAVLTRSTKT
jgi:1,4-dihydroxy-2-naphthoyl-CoA hydrolase